MNFQWHSTTPKQQTKKAKTLLSVKNVSKRFRSQDQYGRSFQDTFINLLSGKNEQSQDNFWSLRNISFDVKKGDCFGLIGPNGSGKSTLLKIISGIIEPTYGQVTVDGRISSLLELGAGFHPDLTGRENIYLNGSIYGLTRHEMHRRLDEIIEFSELEDFIDMPVKHYSSGMYVRLGFAVAINTKPDLLLVDEVLAVGDANFQRKCLDTIYSFRNQGGTLLLVTHDLATVQSMCNQAVWFDEGQIQNLGHPTDVVMSYMQRIAEEENRARLQQRALEEQEEEELTEDISEEDVPEEDEVEIVPEADLQDEDVLEEESTEESEPVEETEVEEPLDIEPEENKSRWGTGEIDVFDVEFLDVEGKRSFVFRTGDLMEIRLHYKAKVPIEEPIFGIAIYRQDNTHVCGPNTKFGNLSIPRVEGTGYIAYKIAELPLLEGSFLLTLAVINQSDTVVYDFQDRVYSFNVYPGETQERYGMVTLLGEWEWDERGATPIASDELHILELEEDEGLTDDLDELALLDASKEEASSSEELEAVV